MTGQSPGGKRALILPSEVREKFEHSVDRSGGPAACHPWTGSIDPSTGYGQLNWQVLGGKRRVHVVAWELEHDEEVPRDPATGKKLDVDHTCHNEDTSCPGGKRCWHRPCCNEAHLEVKKPQDNKDAADEPRARGRFRTHFDCGCAITEENTYVIIRKGTRKGRLRAPERRCKKHERIKQSREAARSVHLVLGFLGWQTSAP